MFGPPKSQSLPLHSTFFLFLPTFQFGAFLTGPRLLKVHCESHQVLLESTGAFIVDLFEVLPTSSGCEISLRDFCDRGEKQRMAEVTAVCTQSQMSVFIFSFKEKNTKNTKDVYIYMIVIILIGIFC